MENAVRFGSNFGSIWGGPHKQLSSSRVVCASFVVATAHVNRAVIIMGRNADKNFHAADTNMSNRSKIALKALQIRLGTLNEIRHHTHALIQCGEMARNCLQSAPGLFQKRLGWLQACPNASQG